MSLRLASVVVTLDAPREGDLLDRGQQRHPAHVVEVETHGVTARLLGGEVELGRLLDLVLGSGRGVLRDVGVVGDLDAQVGEREQQLFDLRGSDLDVTQRAATSAPLRQPSSCPSSMSPWTSAHSMSAGVRASVSSVEAGTPTRRLLPLVPPAVRGTSTTGGGRRRHPVLAAGDAGAGSSRRDVRRRAERED